MNALLLVLALLPAPAGAVGALTKAQAVALAEKFVLQNGYTDADATKIKKRLDQESLEFAPDRKTMLEWRYNTLRAKAIGIRKGRKGGEPGWSVAFESREGISCRVVTLAPDGSKMRVEHVPGERKAFEGFD